MWVDSRFQDNKHEIIEIRVGRNNTVEQLRLSLLSQMESIGFTDSNFNVLSFEQDFAIIDSNLSSNQPFSNEFVLELGFLFGSLKHLVSKDTISC